MPRHNGGVARDRIREFIGAIEAGEVTSSVLQLALADMAAAGFEPLARERVPAAMAGRRYRGQEFREGDLLPSSEAQYLLHAVALEEWPPGTTLAAYLRSLRDAALDSRSGVCFGRHEGEHRLAIAAPSGDWRGPHGATFIVLLFDPLTRHWTGGFQPAEALAWFESPAWRNVHWPRRPFLD